jgi:hypothetical protein
MLMTRMTVDEEEDVQRELEGLQREALGLPVRLPFHSLTILGF